MLAICQSGYESLLRSELSEAGLTPGEGSAGWVNAAAATTLPDGNVFAHLALIEPVEVVEQSVNALARRIAELFLQSIQGRRIEAPWTCHWFSAPEAVGLGRRVSSVEKAFLEEIARKVPRVAKLAAELGGRRSEVGGQKSDGGGQRAEDGLFVFFSDFGRVFVSTKAAFNGQRRMADDPLAPSRSYLKVEEAYGVLGREPQPGETVVDLGAAPGGWSYSAAKRGAKVEAIDNGPLKGGAAGNPSICHKREDAFAYRPERAPPATPLHGRHDWLFCDLVEEPHHVLKNIVEPWLAQRWCRWFVVNFKFGRVDALGLIRALRAADSPFVRYASNVRIIHLYHDREELTVVGNCTEGR